MEEWFRIPKWNRICNRIIREIKQYNGEKIDSVIFLSNYKNKHASRYKINLAIASSNNTSTLHKTASIIYTPHDDKYDLVSTNDYAIFTKFDKKVHWI